MANYYQILELPNFASPEAIRKSYRKLALQYHPDKHGGNVVYENKFKEINAAYQILGDPQKKVLYDQRLLYGYSPPLKKTTSSYNSAHKSNNTANSQPKSYKKEPRRKKPVIASHYQKAFVKFSYALFGVLFILVISTWGLEQQKNGKQELDLAKQQHLSKIEFSLQKGDLSSSESLIDSIDFFSSYISKKGNFTKILDNKYRQLATNYDKQNQFKQGLEAWYESLRIQNKYGLLRFKEEVKLTILEHLFFLGQVNKAIHFFNHEISGKMNNFEANFLLTDVLLRYGHQQIAYAQLKKNTQWIFKGLRSAYGDAFYFTVRPGDVSQLRLKELAQFYCLHKTLEANDSFSSLPNFLIKNSTDAHLKELFLKLKNKDFNFDLFCQSGEYESMKNELLEFQLATLLESCK